MKKEIEIITFHLFDTRPDDLPEPTKAEYLCFKLPLLVAARCPICSNLISDDENKAYESTCD